MCFITLCRHIIFILCQEMQAFFSFIKNIFTLNNKRLMKHFIPRERKVCRFQRILDLIVNLLFCKDKLFGRILFAKPSLVWVQLCMFGYQMTCNIGNKFLKILKFVVCLSHLWNVFLGLGFTSHQHCKGYMATFQLYCCPVVHYFW